MFGRWINLPGIMSYKEWERAQNERYAVSYKIQGSAAEVLKLAIIKLDELDIPMVANIHDEILIEHLMDVSATIKQVMEDVVKLSVPLIASVGTGHSWGEAK